MGRLLFAEHCFAQVVDVHRHPLLTAHAQVGVQGLRFTGDDGSTAAGSHLFDQFGHGQAGKIFAHADEKVDKDLFQTAEKFRYALLAHQAADLVGHPFGISGAKALVDHFAQQHLVPGMGQQTFHLFLELFFLPGEQLIGPVLPLFRQGDGLIDECLLLDVHAVIPHWISFGRLIFPDCAAVERRLPFM